MILKPMALVTFKVKALRFKAQPYSMSNGQSSLSNYNRKFKLGLLFVANGLVITRAVVVFQETISLVATSN